MQDFLYFCAVKWKILFILSIVGVLTAAGEESFNSQLSTFNYTMDDIVLDIYNAVTEFGDADYEQLQTDLYALHEQPIDLNHTSEEELSQLVFLSPRQIDDILMHVDKHPMESLYELRMIGSLADYEIRNLLPFVTITGSQDHEITKLYPRDVFRNASHELLTRIDARNIEGYSGTDPMYVQTRYRFDYRRQVVFGAQLRRPAGGMAQDLEYGAYLQLRDLGHLHTLVAGNYQASFGQGLVFAPVFHNGKSAYVASVGQTTEGLRYYSSADGEGLHGVGATMRWNWSKATRLDVSALYSMKRANDSTWHHLLGANMTLRHQRLQVELTAAENIWTDSIHPYRNAAYNQHYFRGYRQFVGGASARYNYGWFDAFAEVATSQNYQRAAINGAASNSETLNAPHWGVGALAGSRFYPTDGVSLVALYRYYSPYFDNALGYGFSETSRLGDENGGYIGWDINRWKGWRINGYADVFYFSGPKYGVPEAPSLGYDALLEVKYGRDHATTKSRNYVWYTLFRARARKKGSLSTYSARAQFNWSQGPWTLRTTADANYVSSYGVSVAQDISYNFQVPLSLRLRLQGFDAREWNNRIYLYEHDVLYAFSIPATYGLGGRVYLCLRWQVIKQLALYLRVSETVYERTWASQHNRAMTRTDVHLLLRAKL